MSNEDLAPSLQRTPSDKTPSLQQTPSEKTPSLPETPSEKTPLLPVRDSLFVTQLHIIIESNTYYWILFIGVLINVVGFLLSTEKDLASSVETWRGIVDMISTGWFFADYVARIVTSNRRGMTWYRYMFLSVYAYIDLVAFLPSVIDTVIFRRDVLIETQWMKCLRLFYPLQRTYLGFNFFSTVFMHNLGLLLTSGFCGLTVWIVCSAMYFCTERNNEAMKYCPNPNESSTCYNRFETIPSSMFFALQNFFGEYPLADDYSAWGRVIAIIIQMFGAAVIAIPAGLFGSAFESVVKKQIAVVDEEEEESSEEDKKTVIVKILDGRRGVWSIPVYCTRLDAGYLYSTCCRILASFSCAHCIFSLPVEAPLFNAFFWFLRIGYYCACVVFAVEWGLRVLNFRSFTHWKSDILHFIIDTLSWLPQAILLFLPGNPVLTMLRVCVIFKHERFEKAFTKFDNILEANAAIFVVTGYVAFACWLFCSCAMYYAERDNPDPEMQRHYSSVSTAMWVTLINCIGESPLSDYTILGRWISALMGLIAVGIVTIPMGVLGNGFQDWLSEVEAPIAIEDVADETVPSSSQHPSAGKPRSSKERPSLAKENMMAPSQLQPKWIRDDEYLSPMERIFRFLEGNRVRKPKWFAVAFEITIFVCIGVCCAIAICETVDGLIPAGSAMATACTVFTTISVFIFTAEFLLRFYCAPADPYYKQHGYTSSSAARLRYVLGPLSLIDLLAIVPFYLVHAGFTSIDKYDEQLRMFRVLRLTTLDTYVPSLRLISRVISRNAAVLRLASYVTFCLWILFSALLVLLEHNDDTKEIDLKMSQRYYNLASAMPYTLAHLTGDFALIEYLIGAKIVLAIAVIVAVGVVAVPAGILAGGFRKELKLFRKEQREEKRHAMTVIDRAVHSYIVRRRFKNVVSSAVQVAREEKRIAEVAERENKLIIKVHHVLEMEDWKGKMYATMQITLTLLNVVMVLLESLKPMPLPQLVFDIFEGFSVVIFTIDYGLRVWTASVNKSIGFSRVKYCISFLGVVDLVTTTPWYIEMILLMCGKHIDSFVFRLFRLFRILQLEKFIRAFRVLGDVWHTAKDSLVSTLFIALVIWIAGSCLFFQCEKNNKREQMDVAFKDLPSSMYYSAIFLGGEWVKIDFTHAGKIVCMLYCLAGVAVFSLPVASVFEAFGEALADDDAIDLPVEPVEVKADV